MPRAVDVGDFPAAGPANNRGGPSQRELWGAVLGKPRCRCRELGNAGQPRRGVTPRALSVSAWHHRRHPVPHTWKTVDAATEQLWAELKLSGSQASGDPPAFRVPGLDSGMPGQLLDSTFLDSTTSVPGQLCRREEGAGENSKRSSRAPKQHQPGNEWAGLSTACPASPEDCRPSLLLRFSSTASGPAEQSPVCNYQVRHRATNREGPAELCQSKADPAAEGWHSPMRGRGGRSAWPRRASADGRMGAGQKEESRDNGDKLGRDASD